MTKIIHRTVLVSILFLNIFTAKIALSAGLSSNEEKIKSIVRANLENQIVLIKKLVDVNTATNNTAGIKQNIAILKNELEQLHFKTWQDQSAIQFNQAPYLFAKYESSQNKAPTILLLGHMDTVYPDTHQGKFERHGNVLKGPGIIDMKAGDATIIYLLKALSETGNIDKYNFYVAFISDEEMGGSVDYDITRKELREIAKKSDYVLEFEPASSRSEAAIGIRNYVFWKVSISGKQGHSSQIMTPEMGAGAIYEAARIVNQIRLQTDTAKGISTNIGIIAGGTFAEYNKLTYQGRFIGKSNIVPSVAEIVGDMRALSDEDAIKQLANYRQIIKNNLPKTSAFFTYTIENPAMPVTEGNIRLLKVYSRVSHDLGYGNVLGGDPKKQVATDISFAGQLVKKGALSRLGPFGQGMHSGINESTTVEDVLHATEKSVILVNRLAALPDIQ